MISPIFRSLRPRHWVKNLLLFTALVFSNKSTICSWESWLYVLAGFFTFCALSGSVYLLNDIIDLAKDRIHPVKCNRPLASGLLSVKEAKVALLLVFFITLLASWYISPLFFSVSLGYFLLNLAYSLKLKKIAIIDVICVGIGYVLRAIAGVGALKTIHPEITLSNLLILSIFFFSIFLTFLKLRQEILIAENKAVLRQKEFSNYSVEYIDKITPMMVGITIVIYSFYSLMIGRTDIVSDNKLIYTIPILLYICLRYLFLVHIEEENETTIGSIIINDKPLILSGILFAISIVVINIY